MCAEVLWLGCSCYSVEVGAFAVPGVLSVWTELVQMNVMGGRNWWDC